MNDDLYVKGNGWAAAWETYRRKVRPVKPQPPVKRTGRKAPHPKRPAKKRG